MKSLFGLALIVIGIGFYVYALVFWFRHDTFTAMQIFKHFWGLYVGGWFLQMFGVGLIKSR